ncbi:MAG: hypothetical protein LBV46_00520 [Bacteroidales bacterium]|jgi:predicted NUDIX family NTP pyrophosphohydrolase|nr:hypothetical protein [Bacteroidales bacterium]
MKKIISLLTVAIFACNVLVAQNVKDAAFDYDKAPVKGITNAIYDKSATVVVAAIKDRMEKGAGLKPSKGKDGFTIYANQLLPALGVANSNIYIKVAEEGKKGSKVVMIYFYVTTMDYTNVNSENNPEMYGKMLQYMTEMGPYIDRYDAEQNLIKAQNVLLKEQKNMEKLNSDFEKLNADKAKLEKQLSDKNQEISNKSAELDRAKESVNKATEEVEKYKAPLK